MSQQALCDQFNNDVQAMLPLSFVKARVSTLLGRDAIVIDFAINQKWVNNIIHNDPLHMRVLVGMDKGKYVIDGSYMPGRALKSIGVQYRKLSGNTEAEVIAKFTAWFNKNAQFLKLLGDY